MHLGQLVGDAFPDSILGAGKECIATRISFMNFLNLVCTLHPFFFSLQAINGCICRCVLSRLHPVQCISSCMQCIMVSTMVQCMVS